MFFSCDHFIILACIAAQGSLPTVLVKNSSLETFGVFSSGRIRVGMSLKGKNSISKVNGRCRVSWQ